MLFDTVINALNDLKRLSTMKDDVLKNRLLQAALLWNLYVAVQGTIDLALKIISILKLGIPTSYSNAFEILYDHKVITHDLKERLVQMVKFRHILAHVYPKLDIKRILKDLDGNIKDIYEFLKQVEIFLNKRGLSLSKL